MIQTTSSGNTFISPNLKRCRTHFNTHSQERKSLIDILVFNTRGFSSHAGPLNQLVDLHDVTIFIENW